MPTYRLTIAYDGTGLVGWQRQPSGTSVQGLLENALSELESRPVAVVGASRTDAGVHALGQVASCTIDRIIAPSSLAAAINMRLPPTVRVLEALETSPEFHARFNATSKRYRYRIWTGPAAIPFERDYVLHLPNLPLDTDAMGRAAALLEGRRDFAAFQATDSITAGTERTIFSVRVIGEAGVWRGGGRLITVEVRGDGFLRHMVRIIVGTLVEVGRGFRPVAWVSDVLASRDRTKAGPTVPAAGLFLVNVDYE